MKSCFFFFAALFWVQVLQAQAEPDAGKWATLVITSAKDFRLPPPPGKEATATELRTVLHLQKSLDSATAAQVRYWNAGAPSYRWREVLSGFVQDDSIGVVTIGNLLFHTAVYDATIAAWDTKYAYNRPRPFAHNGQVKTLVHRAASPSYPCEYSVAAGVAVAMVAHFFPDKADSVRQLAEVAMRSRVAAGVQYPSDTKAGFQLGQQVAAVALLKAKDYMPVKTWDGKMPQQTGMWSGPKPMGTSWGFLKPVVMDSASQFRPPPPPDYKAEMEELRNFKQSLKSMSNAFYFATQPFWPELLDKKIFEYNVHLNPPRAAQMYALRQMAVYDGRIACWEAKYTYWGTRPDQYDTTYKPVLMETPPFPGYPSGHALFAGVNATILSYFFPEDKAYFWKKAKEACEARFEGGVHFRTDNTVGMEMGIKVAELVLQKAAKNNVNQKRAPAFVKNKGE